MQKTKDVQFSRSLEVLFVFVRVILCGCCNVKKILPQSGKRTVGAHIRKLDS